MCISKEDVKKFDIGYFEDDAEIAAVRQKKWGYGVELVHQYVDPELALVAWNVTRTKAYEEKYIYLMEPRLLSRFIKRRRTRSNSLKSWFEKDGKILTGEEKWDFLYESIKTHGWDTYQPACLQIRSGKKVKVANGHHRIGIAFELGLQVIPISFLYK